jgi:diphthamide biosynthesis protein 3
MEDKNVTITTTSNNFEQTKQRVGETVVKEINEDKKQATTAATNTNDSITSSKNKGDDWMHAESNSNAVYEEVNIKDMEWNEEEEAYFYPCPCGDEFIMPIEDLEDGEDIALCPSCSLRIRVLYDPKQFSGS